MSLPVLSGVGRLTADPDLRFAPSGTAVAKIPLAFNSRKRNQAGEWEDADVLFVNGTLFGDRAEAAVEVLLRGTEVTVVGRLKTRQWEQDGEKRSAPELLIDAIGQTPRSAAKKSARSDTARTDDPWSSNQEAPF